MATNPQFENIPAELRQPPLWLQYYLSPDPKKPDKKPRKHPCVKYATPEDRSANLRSLDYLLENRQLAKGGGYQRYVQPNEGFIFIDLDHARDEKTGDAKPWAAEIIESLSTYTEVSASGTGFHLVARGTLPEDFKLDPNPVEIYSGHIPNKLMAMTGDVVDFRLTIENRQSELEELLRRAQSGEFGKGKPPLLWRETFHTVDELPDGDIEFLIEDVLPTGVCFVGALSGTGKTWFCLSMARALTTGKRFVDVYGVPAPVPVLYLCPEMNAKAFKRRLLRFGIKDNFYCQTISDGAPLDFTDPELAASVKELRPVVFLDTAIRFSNIDDENSASQTARGLARAVFGLIHLGAAAVVCLHHRAKDNATQDREMTLENVLRGSGDLGAMCDVVWGLQYDKGTTGDQQYLKDSRRLVRLQVRCVKARDFIPPEDFRVQLDPYIDDIGDMAVIEEQAETRGSGEMEVDRLSKAIEENPTASIRQMEKLSGVGRNRIPALAVKAGWTYDEKKKWNKAESGLVFA